MSKKITPGNISGTTWKMGEAMLVDNMYSGYAVQVQCSAAATHTIKVYESLGGANGVPDTSVASEWTEVEITSGVSSPTDAFMLNVPDFKGAYIYVEIDASGGSITDPMVYLKAK